MTKNPGVDRTKQPPILADRSGNSSSAKEPNVLESTAGRGEAVRSHRVAQTAGAPHAKSAVHTKSAGKDSAARVQKEPAGFIAPRAHILIVDDIVTNLYVAEGLMSIYEMHIDSCTNGADAVIMAMKRKYDIIFMDHMMPEMDGAEATAHIRAIASKDDYFRKLPIIALSANSVDGARTMFLEIGMSDFLPKPINMNKLDEILRKWLPAEKQQAIVPDEQDSDAKGGITAGNLKIIGIHVPKGLQAVGGNMTQYLINLGSFVKEWETRLAAIKHALDARDYVPYVAHVHALRVAADTIGASRLSELAGLLEDAGRGKDYLCTENFTVDLLRRLRTLLNNIEAALPETPIVDEESSALQAYRRNLCMLKDALQNMNPWAAENALTELQRESISDDVTGAIFRLNRLILLFCYDEAILLIDRLLAESNPDVH